MTPPTAQNLAMVLWVGFFFLPYFNSRLYYAVFLVLIAVIGGFSALEYAPALFLPLELVFGVGRLFSRVSSRLRRSVRR